MKKVFLSLAIVAALTVVSCKQAEGDAAATADSATAVVDSVATETVEAIDSTAEAATDSVKANAEVATEKVEAAAEKK